jgi:hypothetical protein
MALSSKSKYYQKGRVGVGRGKGKEGILVAKQI